MPWRQEPLLVSILHATFKRPFLSENVRISIEILPFSWVQLVQIMVWHRAGANPFHDDVIKWKHFPRYWPFVRGIHRSPVNSPHKGQWRGALMFSLICAWINTWVNNREAGDLRRYRNHYDVTVMDDPFYRLIYIYIYIYIYIRHSVNAAGIDRYKPNSGQCWSRMFTAWWRHQMEEKIRVTGPLWGESTGHRWIPRTKASDAELWCFLWSASE